MVIIKELNLLKVKLVAFIVLLVIVLTLFFHEPIIRMFKNNEHLKLQYEKIDYAEILFSDRDGLIEINNGTVLKKLVSYLNGLELIEEPRNYVDEPKDAVTIYLYGCMSPTVVSFSENYLYFSDAECWDCNYTNYYIKSIEYDITNTIKFLDILIDEYTEK